MWNVLIKGQNIFAFPTSLPDPSSPSFPLPYLACDLQSLKRHLMQECSAEAMLYSCVRQPSLLLASSQPPRMSGPSATFAKGNEGRAGQPLAPTLYFCDAPVFRRATYQSVQRDGRRSSSGRSVFPCMQEISACCLHKH